MLGIGFQELLLVLVVALVVVGPKKLPDLAKGLGKGLKEFRKATDDLKSNLHDNETFKDLQGIKSTMQDTVSSLNPKGLLDLEAPTSSAPVQPTPELKKFETPSVTDEEAAAPLLEPKKPQENLEGRMAVMDGIVSEHHQPAPEAPPSPKGQPAGQPEAGAQAAAPVDKPSPAASTEAPRKTDA